MTRRKKNQPTPKKKTAKSKPKASSSTKVEEVIPEIVQDAPLEITAQEALTEITEVLKKKELPGYVLAIAGKKGDMMPFVAASSLGELLTLKYLLDKEIDRVLIKAFTSPAQ